MTSLHCCPVNTTYWLDRSIFPADLKSKVDPYLLPYDSPVRERLDRIYAQCKTHNEFWKVTHCSRNVDLVKHTELMELGLVVKKPGFNAKPKELLRRVEAHSVARELITKKNLTHVKAPQNWLYPLPNAQTSFLTILAHHVYRLIRPIVKFFSIELPPALKYGNSLLRNRFIIVEEYIDITYPEDADIEKVPEAVMSEWKEVFEAVGFQDAHKGNFSLKDNTITLFDLDLYSHKSERNKRYGEIGMETIFWKRIPCNHS